MGNLTISSDINAALTASKQLLAFYNANTAGNQVKKFADRKTAERRCALLAEELADEGFSDDDIISAILNGEEAKREEESSRHGAYFDAPEATEAAEPSPAEFIPSYNHEVCPKCGSTEIFNGRADHGIVVDEDKIAGCHACDWYQDDRQLTATTGRRRGPVPAIAESMRLDRRTTCLETGEEWSNAGKIWTTHGTEWMTNAMHDKLTRTLYSAAKKGEKVVFSINGRSFVLTQFL